MKGESLMVLTRKEVDEDISTDVKWIMVIKKEQLIVINFALELEWDCVVLDVWCIGSDYRNLFPVGGVVKRQISELDQLMT